MSLVTRIEGPIDAVELMSQLATCVTENEAELVAARADREQRTQTQLIRQQQDAAYEESLRMDREKARRKMELEEAARKERDAERLKQEEETARINVKKQQQYSYFASLYILTFQFWLDLANFIEEKRT